MIVRGGGVRAQSLEDLLSAPFMSALDRVDVRSRKVFSGKMAGERRSKTRGQSVEFADHREYAPGDDIRRIDWNVYARLERLFVKLFVEEQDLGVHIALDCSASMLAGGGSGSGGGEGAPSKLQFGARLATAIGYIGLVNRNRVSLATFGGRTLEQTGEMRGRHNVHRFARFLLDRARAADTAAPGPGAGFNEALRTIGAARRGRGVMIVLSDFLVREGYEKGLAALSAGMGREAGAGDSFDTWCLQVLSPGEVDPAAEGGGGEAGVVGDLRLTDVETGEGREVTVTAAVVRAYKRRLEAYLEGLRAHCAARGMTHLVLRSDLDAEEVVLRTLRERGLLG